MDKLIWQNTEIGFADDLGCMNNCDGEYVCDTIDVNSWAKVA